MSVSQLDILKAAFDRGEYLSVAEALTLYGVYALSQRVGELDRSGYAVEHERITLPNGKRIARYHKFICPYG